MTFIAQIKADGSQFQATVDTLATKLTGLETKAKEAGDTTTTAFDKAGGATEGFTEKVVGSTSAHDKLIQALDRERDMLAAINGPAKQYAQNLETLDSLLTKDMISTEQYAEQVRKLNAELERGSTIRETEPSRGGGGSGFNINGLGRMLTSSAGVAGFGYAVLGIGHQVEGLINEYRQLDDEFINITNHANKFVDSSHAMNDVMAQQVSLADGLHLKIAQTESVYDQTRNALIDFNLSASEMARVTKTLGEAAQLDFKSIDSVGEVINRTVLAMQSGAQAGLSLRRVMVEFPSVAHLWESAFNTTEAGLMKLASAGKVTAADLVSALYNSTSTIDQSFTKFHASEEQQVQMATERANVIREQGIAATALQDAISGTDSSNYIYNLGQLEKYHRLLAQAQHDGTAELARFNEGVATLDSMIGHALDKLKLFQIKQADENVKNMFAGLGNGVSNDYDSAAYAEMFERYSKLHESEKERAADLNALKDLQKAYNLPASEYNKLLGEIEPSVRKVSELEQAEKSILESLHGPSDRYNLDVAALGELLEHNKISIDEYITKLHELSDAYTKSDTALKMAALSARGGITGELGYQVAAPQAGPTSLPYETATGFAFPAEQQDPKKLTDQWNKELAKYEQSVKKTEETLSKLFQPLVNGINQFFQTGQLNMKQLGASILDTIEQIIMKEAEMWAISRLAGALTPGMPNVFASGGPMSGSVFGALLGGVPGFASGGDGVVGGSGGTDSQIFIARATPGEHYSFRTPHQMAQQESSGSRPMQVTLIDGRDPRAITSAYAQSAEFETHVLRIARKHGFKRN